MRKRLQKSHVIFRKERVSSLEELRASLIVIAGGQNFPLKRFLGVEAINESTFPIHLTYRSFVFPTDELNFEGSKQYYYQVDPPLSKLGGVISPIENGKTVVTLIESEESLSPCATYEDFLKKASDIPGGKFLKIIERASPVSDLAIFRKPTTHKRTLNLEKIPENVIVIGDSLISFNPVFGQGMTLSLLQAEVLNDLLKKNAFSAELFYERCRRLSTLPLFLSRVGSYERGYLKSFLRLYLKASQRFSCIHHLFLKQLHSFKLLPRD